MINIAEICNMMLKIKLKHLINKFLIILYKMLALVLKIMFPLSIPMTKCQFLIKRLIQAIRLTMEVNNMI